MTLLDPWLLGILRCPVDHTPVAEDEAASVLRCEQGHVFPVEEGIPDMRPPEQRSEEP